LKIKKNKVIIRRDYSHVVLKEFDDSYFDWIYIDGRHEYDVVKKDLELSDLKVKLGGFITQMIMVSIINHGVPDLRGMWINLH